jgi:GNAT superfamily N-acetyltransferase
MRLLTYDELPPDVAPTLALTQSSAFGGPFLPRQLRRYRRGRVFAPYVGVFAVEDGGVIGQTYCLRFPFTFPDGLATVGGIAAVATRPDQTGRGIARRILEEVHRHEREDGVERVALWTNRSWGAHRIYERLGYRDVHHPAFALRWFETAPPPLRGVTVRRARRSDLEALEALHTRATRRRRGFTPRLPGAMVTEADATGAEFLGSVWVAVRDRRPVGYAILQPNAGRVACGELIAETRAAEEALFRQHARLARRRWGILDLSVAADHPERLRREGYTVADRAWFVLMGARSDLSESSTRARVREWGTDDPRWVCYRGDRF